MKTNKCPNCEQTFDKCICPAVAKFFEDNKHLMQDQSKLKKTRSKFYYFDPEQARKHSVTQ